MTPEQRLWLAALNVKIEDAIYPFKIPANYDKKSTIEQQYKEFVRKRKKGIDLPYISPSRSYDQRKAIHFLESDQLDFVAEEAGYGSYYVARVCQFIQHALTLKKDLYTK